MCKQDFQIWRRLTYRFHTGLSTGAGNVLSLPPLKSRVGLIVLTPNTGSARLAMDKGFNTNHEVLQVGSGDSAAGRLLWRDYGPVLWEGFSLHMTALSSWTLIEQFLDLSDEELDHYLRVDL